MPKVSVIIPIYNVEQYLRQCLDSVLAQTMADIEVICVNDGSTDGSLAVLREYAEDDGRMIVVDKPNGGYGHSVNTGLARAGGEYVAIVEPDDFIDSTMYEALYATAALPGGRMADVVKSAYWEFYDEEGNSDGRVESPNLSKCMPKKRTLFAVETSPEVLYHHPSIWSAIYKRSFMEREGIRFVEAKGAGWADNPFFFETLCLAKEIVWTPEPYYYYRKTNYEASSYLRDYTIPFDRCREIHGFLKDRGITSETILGCLYCREFSYIFSILERFGFSESDPHLLALIRETLDRMDEKIVLSHSRLRKERKDYYLEVTGRRSSTIAPRQSVENPRVSVIVPFKDRRMYVWNCLQSLARQSLRDIEIICVDCGSADLSKRAVEEFAKKDKRFALLDEPTNSIAEGLNLAMDLARGEYLFFCSPRFVVNNKSLESACSRAASAGMEVAVFEAALRHESVLAPFATSVDEFGPLSCADVSTHIFNIAGDHISTKLFQRAYIVRSALRFTEPDVSTGVRFGLLALAGSERLGYFRFALVERQRIPVEAPSPISSASVPVFGSLKTIGLPSIKDSIVEAGIFDGVERSFVNYALAVMMNDLGSLTDAADFRQFSDMLRTDYMPRLGTTERGGRYFYDQALYNRYVCIEKGDREAYLLKRVTDVKHAHAHAARSLAKTRTSESYRIGRRVVRLLRALLPARVIAEARRWA